MKKNCIVTVGVGDWYPRGISRLQESIQKVGFDGDFVPFINTYPPNCPPHSTVPYAFKPCAFEAMRQRGYENVMWLDASFWAIAPFHNMFDIIEKDGHLMVDADHFIGIWSSDKVLESFNLTRDMAMSMKMFLAGGFGLSFKSERSNKFLDKWLDRSKDGFSFIGKWDNKDRSVSNDPRCHGHRHDMTVGSILAHELKMSYFKVNTFMAYYQWYETYKHTDEVKDKSISFLLQGL